MRVKTETGVMLNGLAWGIVYQDGHVKEYGWVEPYDAPMHNPKHCKRPSDITYAGDRNLSEINRGKLVPVERQIETSIVIG